MIYNILRTIINKNHKNANFIECSYSTKISDTRKCEDIYNYWDAITNRFETLGEVNDYVQIHIKNFYIIPSNYMIQTINLGSGHSHLRSWTLSASINGEVWLELDKQEEVSDLNSYLAIKHFPLKEYQIPFSYFRITIIESWDPTNINRLSLTHLDFNGSITNTINCFFTSDFNKIKQNLNFIKMSTFICLF